jgi:phage tail sheath protein FI
MPEYLAPGVFVEEVELKPPSIDAVSTSTTGMVGHASRGPSEGRPVLVTNMLQFRQRFGGPIALASLPAAEAWKGELYYAAQGFFANGGRRLYVMRAAAAGAKAAEFAAKGGLVTRLAPGADVPIDGATKTLRPATTLGLMDAAKVRLIMVKSGITYKSTQQAIAASGVEQATGKLSFANPIDVAPVGPGTYGAGATAVETDVTGLKLPEGTPTFGGARPASLVLQAAESGTWGGGVVVTAAHVPGARAIIESLTLPSADDNNQVTMKSVSGFYVNAWVEIDIGDSTKSRILRKVLAITDKVLTLSGKALTAAQVTAAPGAEAVLTVREFSLTATYDGFTESFPSLTLENVSGKFVSDVLKARSALLRVKTLPADTHPILFPSGDDGLTLAMTTAGVDAPPGPADMRGADNGPGKRSGLRALEEIQDISIIAAPGWGEISVQEAMIEQCERLKYRVALLDPEAPGGNPPTLTDVQNQRSRFDSKYAALYYPRIVIRDATDALRNVGPAGHMAGICARVDNERGVHKAPGNETMRNIVDLEAILTKGEHEILNPRNINVIRDFRDEGRGLRIYGARCITSLNDWKYLPVRRLFIFIERSIEIGTQWAVLEPNDQRLWDRLIDSVDSFLNTQWRAGALMGSEKGQAYYIRCGTATMTQDDIDNGRLIMEIGIAPVKPAEFVIIRIGQWAGGSFTAES